MIRRAIFLIIVVCGCSQKPDPPPVETSDPPTHVDRQREASATVTEEPDEGSPDLPRDEPDQEPFPDRGPDDQLCSADADCTITHLNASCCEGCGAWAVNVKWAKLANDFCVADRTRTTRCTRFYCKQERPNVSCDKGRCRIIEEYRNATPEVVDD